MLLEARHIFRTYTKGSVNVQAVQDISFRVQEGEFLSIVGRSGSGKSTLLNLIGGLDTASSGRIIIQEKDLSLMKRYELALHRRNTVGMIFQSFNLIHSRTAMENVILALAFGNVPRKKRKASAVRILDRVGLAHRMDHKPGELSGGEAQRVAIARALANQPKILLADEPTGNLDSKTSDDILKLLHTLNKEGVTVLMVTHDEASSEQVAHRMIRLLDGKIIDEKSFGGLS